MIYGEDLYNSYFDEDDIDYVSERSFSDGFDYACRLFAEAAAKEEAKESSEEAEEKEDVSEEPTGSSEERTEER